MLARDLTKANIGDTVLLRGTVASLDEGDERLPRIGLAAKIQIGRADAAQVRFWVHRNTEVELIHRPLKVGDRVQAEFAAGEIIAIDGETAFVRYDHGGYAAPALSMLTRVSA